MNDLVVPIRRVARFVVFLMLLLVGQLTYLQLINAEELKNNPNNVRTLINKFAIPRGDIVTADNVVVAFSEPSNDQLKFQRVYPQGDLFGHITGHQSFLVGNTGLEESYDDELFGERGQEENVPRVVLTMRADIQQLLKDQLGDNTGAIVVMAAQSGAIIGMYANPSYDPNPIASHDSLAVQESFTALVEDPEKPSVSRAFSERYPPGSIFKILTTSASLESGIAKPDRRFPAERSFTPRQTDRPIQNFGRSSCGGTLINTFVNSCNVTFARLGVELGDSFNVYMNQFGVGGELTGDNNVGPQPPLDIPGTVGASAPLENSFRRDEPSFALAGIGQGRVALSPLSAALMTSAIATGGNIPRPFVVAQVEDGDGTVLTRNRPDFWLENAISPQTAADVSNMMVEVVRRGTGTRASLSNVTVAGKTGTAQRGCPPEEPCPPHAWFTSFAPAENPQYIVTVFLENPGQDATGGQTAAPIARSIYEKLFEVR